MLACVIASEGVYTRKRSVSVDKGKASPKSEAADKYMFARGDSAILRSSIEILFFAGIRTRSTLACVIASEGVYTRKRASA